MKNNVSINKVNDFALFHNKLLPQSLNTLTHTHAAKINTSQNLSIGKNTSSIMPLKQARIFVKNPQDP